MLRLSLDVGTNSIGWCLVEFDEDHPIGTGILDIGVRIFSDGRDPKSGASLAVDRRAARSMRRRRDRYLRRRSVFLENLVQFGLMPADADEAKLVAARDPYTIRARALVERLEPHEIGRALFHLNQRRGFLSNRKAERRSKDGDDGKIAGGAKALDQAMAEAGADTLGQFLVGRTEKRVRLNGENQSYDFYPQRRHIEHEFQRIWEEQAKHHPALLTEDARATLHRVLFFQRPLKEPAVGVCLFAGRYGIPRDERRLPKAHPLFQERRLYEEVNQLEITTPGEASRKLTLDERDKLILALRDKRKVAFTSLARTLKLQPGESFNKASETRTGLIGNEVRAVLGDKKRFGAEWHRKTPEAQWEIVEKLIDEENPDTLHAFLTGRCGLDDAAAEAIAKAPLPEGYGRLGETATRRILDRLKAGVVTYAQAVEACGWHHSDDRTGEVLDKLPYYGELLSRDIPPGSFDPAHADEPERYWGKITNPTVHIGLRQLEKLVNAVIALHGRPDQIVVELARELNLSEDDKKKHEARIRRDTAAAIARGEKLEKEGIANTGANRALLKRWEELNPANPLDRRCPYCAEPIGMQALFSGEADIDHIIPYSRSLDDSAANKVVTHRHCNRAKGNKTPFERWGHDADRWDKIAEQVARLHKSKQWRFGPDAMERVEKDGDFLARQLTDTQYLSRLAGKYLRGLYATKEEGSVYVIPGRMTTMLRRLWGLNTILYDHNIVDNKHSDAPKNRLDHRHHAIDAAVTAVTTRSLLQRIARTAALAEGKDLDRLFEGLDPPWTGYREELEEKLKGVTASHKADHGRKRRPSRHHDVTAGRLHNDTAYGLTGEMAADGKTPIVVHRVPLTSLKPADLTHAERIPDPALREALYQWTRDLTGKPFEAALERFRETHPVFAGIRRVRVREPLNVIPIRDTSGRAYKAYKGDANARFELWRYPDGKLETQVVTMFRAHQPRQDDRPHPAAKRLLTLRQNDLLAVERNGGPREIMRVAGFNVQGRLTLAAANEAGNLKARDGLPNDRDPFKYVYLSGRSIMKAKARQVRVDPLGRLFDPGPRT
ncbi:type II CRISPR RNA-guided endonuclease Cas9 [Stakelama marina]|uniref:CRISPR-associated endonuclease Cas9 n=1 Tax=Stakelama marina TaxID=2826939 RepID=A0A8T4IDF8_9SPHN|nr:type II CRISPR RNA-guided endonuclease Cas9 [Stakelama marina]MBR0552687.1 type II CRISPR RNA-guided endonuclease Cas9 [Stakelama marina]